MLAIIIADLLYDAICAIATTLAASALLYASYEVAQALIG